MISSFGRILAPPHRRVALGTRKVCVPAGLQHLASGVGLSAGQSAGGYAYEPPAGSQPGIYLPTIDACWRGPIPYCIDSRLRLTRWPSSRLCERDPFE